MGEPSGGEPLGGDGVRNLVIGCNPLSGRYDLSVTLCLLLALTGVVERGLLGGLSLEGLPSGVGRLWEELGLDGGGMTSVDVIHGSNSGFKPDIRTFPRLSDAVWLPSMVVGTDSEPAKMDDEAVLVETVVLLVEGKVIEDSTELALAESSLLDAGSKVIPDLDVPGWGSISRETLLASSTAFSLTMSLSLRLRRDSPVGVER